MLFDLFKKHERYAKLEPSGEKLLVPAGEKLLTAALDAGIAWPHDCRVGSCGKCRCVLTAGKIKPLADFSYTLNADEISRGTILACQSQLKTDIVVDIDLDHTATHTQSVSGVINRITPLTHDIVELEVQLEEKAFAGTVAGQYFDVSNQTIPVSRSYSLARRPEPNGLSTLIFTIRHVPGGEFTDWLFGADRTGSEITLQGPYGDFYLRAPQSRLVCIAGGSGLAPIVAIIEQGISEKRTEECTVLFGARSQNDLYYLERLGDLGNQWLGEFQLVPVLSEEPSNSNWQGARGLVTEQLKSVAGRDGFVNTHAYLCGPPAMIDAAIAELTQLNIRADDVYFDKFLDASSMPAGRN